MKKISHVYQNVDLVNYDSPFLGSPNHPGLAENVAPDGGPGSDIIVVRLLDNSWVQDGSSLHLGN